MQKYFIKIATLTTIATVTRLWGLSEHSFVNNELYIMLHFEYLERGFSSFFQSFFNWEIHPPLNHLFLYFWGKVFGFTELPLRSLSSIFSLLTLFFTYRIARLCCDKKVATLALGLLVVNFAAISLGRMATSYGWLIFYSTLSTYLFVKIDHLGKNSPGQKRLLFLFLLSLVVSSYTHYLSLVFNLILLCLSWHKLFWKNQRTSKIIASFTFATLYAPWVPVILNQFPRLKSHDYPRSLGEHPIFDLFFYFSNKSWILLILLSIVFVKWLLDLKVKNFKKFEILFGCLAVGPILFFYLVSHISTEIWNLHYFALTLPFWVLIISATISRIQVKHLNNITIAFVLGLTTFHYLTDHYEKHYPIRIEIRETIASVVKWHKTSNQLTLDPILNHSWSSYLFNHYFKRHGFPSVTYLVPEGKLDSMKMPSKIKETFGDSRDLKYTKFWLLNTYNPLGSELKDFIEVNYRPVVQFKNRSAGATLYKARVNE